MSMESVKDVVKEEYMAEGYDLDSLDAQASQEVKTKCGEVFMGETGYSLTFVCTQCLRSFPDLPSFGEHIWNTHPIRRNETHAPSILQYNTPALKPEPTDEAVEDSDPNNEEDEKDEWINQEEGTDLKEYEEPASSEEPIPAKRIKKKRGETYCCFSCCLTFGDFGRYRKHYRTAHPDMIERDDSTDMESSNPAKFIPKLPEKMLCKYCLKNFHEPRTYHVHIVSDHTANIYSCPHCPKTFPKRRNRDDHVNAHEGRKPHQCSHCPKAFSNPTNLRTHIKGHLNIKKFSCRFCDQKYVRGSDLRIHERIHTKEKPYQCDECGMSFLAQVKLTNHMRRHQNIKNYKCPLCEKAFFSSFCLKNHVRTHTRESPFSCDICHKKFRAKGSLRSHMLLHSDEKKYTCKLCEKSFAQHSGLYSHMKTHGEIKRRNT